MADIIQIQATVGTEAAAFKIARRLIDKKIAATVHLVGPVTSISQSGDGSKQSENWMLLIQTEGRIYNRVEDVILELNPNKNSEILYTIADAGNLPYLRWISEVVI